MGSEWSLLNSQIVSCRFCPRLVHWREQVAREKRRAFRDWTYWGRPITGFGDPNARVLILGLAPAAHGGNRTGRIFTGDSSGATLMGALYRAGFANQPNSDHAYDGLALYGAYISAICRCAPPDNKPTRQEILNCSAFLASEFELLKNIRVVVALGKIACESYLALLRNRGHALPRTQFSHAAVYPLGDSLPALVCSYHPSQQNTQTGRLTNAMLDDVFKKATALIFTSNR